MFGLKNDVFLVLVGSGGKGGRVVVACRVVCVFCWLFALSREQCRAGCVCAGVSARRVGILTGVSVCVHVYVQRCLGGRRLSRVNASFPPDVCVCVG